MIELARHIEILLLSNDCVIVPSLGGFVAHHVDAFYDEEEQLFLPPSRTIGFNVKLKTNDSLLAQSYAEAYDISYPDALIRIEDEVKELRQHLETEGYYELNGIGVLELNEEGNCLFKPCEAGILTPDLYGLSSFEMKPLVSEMATVASNESSQERAIVIKMSWIRNMAAVAAAIVAFFIFTSPVSNSVSDHTRFSIAEFSIGKKEVAPVTSVIEKKVVAQAIRHHDSIAQAKSLSAPIAAKEKQSVEVQDKPSVNQPAAATPSPDLHKQSEESGYCLVLASCVAKDNAENFVKQLHRAGFTQARVYTHHNIRRVIYGHYASQNEAYNSLRSLQPDKNFKEAWVYQIK